MSTRTNTATPPPQTIDQPHVRKRRHKTPPGWMSLTEAMEFLSSSRAGITQMIVTEQVRTRQLPHEKHPKVNREDIERIAREAVRVGLPPQESVRVARPKTA